jgi:phosphoglycolate phosphatase
MTGTTILWDIDGTLLASDRSGRDLYRESIGELVPDAKVGEVVTHGKTDLQIAQEYLRGASLDLGIAPSVIRTLDRLSAFYSLPSQGLEALPGAVTALRRFQALGIGNGLLTGNTPMRARYKLEGAGIEPSLIDWSRGFFGIDTPVRSLLAVAARRALADEKLVIIGDTPADGEAAAAAEIPFIAVCTGSYTAQQLSKLNPAVTIQDLVTGTAEIERYLSLLAWPDGAGSVAIIKPPGVRGSEIS